jgi:hypothetical protein
LFDEIFAGRFVVKHLMFSILSLVDTSVDTLLLECCKAIKDAVARFDDDELLSAASDPKRNATKSRFASCAHFAHEMSKLYARLIQCKYDVLNAFSRSAEFAAILRSNKKALDAFKQLVRISNVPSATSSTSSSADDVFLSHSNADKDYAKLVFDQLRDVEKLATFFEDDTTRHAGDSMSEAVRRIIGSCKVGVVMLTPEFVGKKWPVFEWFFFEARAELCQSSSSSSSSSSFRLLHDICALPQTAHWRSLGWPLAETSWIDVVQRLPLLSKVEIRTSRLRNGGDRTAHVGEIGGVVRQLHSGRSYAPRHRTPDGTFRNNYTDEMRNFGDVLRWWRESLTAERRSASAPTPIVAPDLARLRAPKSASATWIGHSTVLMQSGGMNIITDPVYSERASPVWFIGPKRAQVYVDIVCCSIGMC